MIQHTVAQRSLLCVAHPAGRLGSFKEFSNNNTIEVLLLNAYVTPTNCYIKGFIGQPPTNQDTPTLLDFVTLISSLVLYLDVTLTCTSALLPEMLGSVLRLSRVGLLSVLY